jgi:fumarate reductase subunit C
MSSYTQTERGLIRDIAPSPAGYHPAGKPRLPVAWWRVNPRYTLYMLRELASVFNALWCAQLLLQLERARQGKDAYEATLAAQRQPAWRAVHSISFAFAVLHSVTFLLAAGKGPTVHVQGHRVPERQIAAGAFAGWATASLAVLLVLLFGARNNAPARNED